DSGYPCTSVSVISVARVSLVKGCMGLAVDERGHIIRVLSPQPTWFVCRHVVLDECCHFGHAVHTVSVVVGSRPPHRRCRRRHASAVLAMAPAALLHIDLLAVLDVGSQFRQM